MNIKQITTKQSQTCWKCREVIPANTKAIARFGRDDMGIFTKFFCDESCYAEYQEKRDLSVNKMLNKLSVQFN